MGDSMAQMHEGGQQPIEERQPVPGTGSDRPLPWPIGPSRFPAVLPTRPPLGNQLSHGLTGQSGHPAIGDSGSSSQGASTYHDPARSVTSNPSR